MLYPLPFCVFFPAPLATEARPPPSGLACVFSSRLQVLQRRIREREQESRREGETERQRTRLRRQKAREGVPQPLEHPPHGGVGLVCSTAVLHLLQRLRGAATRSSSNHNHSTNEWPKHGKARELILGRNGSMESNYTLWYAQRAEQRPYATS